MLSIWQDLRYASRVLRKSPAFTLVAVVTLALGIGANTTIFSVVNSVVVRPLPVRDSGRMVVVWESSPAQGWNRIGPSGPNYLDFRDQSKSFDDLALLEPGTGTFTGFGEPQQAPGLRVTTNFLSVLGIQPALGRDFRSGEGFKDRVVIISDSIWQRHYVRDPGVIGQKETIDGILYTVIGVLPRSFWSPNPAEALVPWGDSDLRGMNRMGHDFGVIGHLRRGVSGAQANSELNAIEGRIGEQFAGMKGWSVTVVPVQDALAENVRTMLVLLLAAVGMVLLIGCANLANLMLARAAGRARQTAIRMALGAARWQLARQFLAESLVTGVAGGVCGLVLAYWSVDLLERLVPQSVSLSGGAGSALRPPIVLDGWSLLFTAALTIGCGIFFGLAPALLSSRANMDAALKQATRGSSAGGRLRSAFAISEVAVALLLLVGAGLAMKSFWRLQQVNPGFAADHVLSMEIELPTDSKYRKSEEQAEFFRRVLDRISSVPAVKSASVTGALPLDPGEARVGFLIEGRPPLAGGQTLPADYQAVSEGYFQTMGIPLRRGRVFNVQDKADRPAVAIISESLARRYWPDGSDPIGQRLRFGRRGIREIVGIVGDVKHEGLDKQVTPSIYTSYLQSPEPRMDLAVRTATDPGGMIRAVKEQVYAVDKDQPVYKIRTMQQVVEESQSSRRFGLLLLAIFAVVALTSAAVGIYGVISYSVTQRTREIGIRMALGARSPEVLGLVMGQMARLTLIGVALGSVAALGLTRLMSSLLYGVSATDPETFVVVAILLSLVAVGACYLPARRAMRVDPMVALRYE